MDMQTLKKKMHDNNGRCNRPAGQQRHAYRMFAASVMFAARSKGRVVKSGAHRGRSSRRLQVRVVVLGMKR